VSRARVSGVRKSWAMSLPTPGERVDHRFHFIKHAVDDGGEPGKRLIDVTVWKPLAQIAGDDALDPLIDLLDPLLGTHAQPSASQQAQAKRRQQTQRQRLTDDMEISLASSTSRPITNASPLGMRRAIARITRVSGAGGSVRTTEIPWTESFILSPGGNRTKLPAILRPSAPNQSGIMNAAGILLQILIDRFQLAFVGQARDEVQLSGDRRVGCATGSRRSSNR